jgi:SAM-dependent methyltransferase
MSFDMLICQQGLQFFDDRPLAAREMNRVLRPNGKVGIEVWQSPMHNPVFQNLFTAIAEVFNVPSEDLARAFSYGSAQELENLLLDAGFRKVEVEPVRHEVHFNDPDRFVELMIKGASAVIPVYATLEASMFSDLLSSVKQKLEGVLSEYTAYGVLTFPMNANIATAIG